MRLLRARFTQGGEKMIKIYSGSLADSDQSKQTVSRAKSLQDSHGRRIIQYINGLTAQDSKIFLSTFCGRGQLFVTGTGRKTGILRVGPRLQHAPPVWGPTVTGIKTGIKTTSSR